jgi:hypothetical protein
MDPTLAPGYVPQSNSKKSKAAKSHHWADVQKNRKQPEISDDVEADSPINVSPTIRSTPVRPVTADGNSVVSRHFRMQSWGGASSALSDNEAIGGPADLEEVPIGVKRQALSLNDYQFPEHRLRTLMDGSSL